MAATPIQKSGCAFVLQGICLAHLASWAVAFAWGAVFGAGPPGLQPYGPDSSKVVHGTAGGLYGVGNLIFLHGLTLGFSFLFVSAVGVGLGLMLSANHRAIERRKTEAESVR